MGLKKKITSNVESINAESINVKNLEEQRKHSRDYDGLLNLLHEGDPSERRWAARDLAEFPQAIDSLCQRLTQEGDLIVREAIFDSLLQISQANDASARNIILELIPLLRSEDTPLRNGVIEVLQNLPNSVAPHMEKLLQDKDSDVRIFAIDILRELAHPDTPAWLLDVINRETHINVLANAVDRLAEVGTEDMVSELQKIKIRFPREPYLSFAVDTAIRRIEGI